MKNFIIDTNVLLQDPEAIYNFEENTVIIPIGVIEELDTFKKDPGALGKNSRQISRQLDVLRKRGNLGEGVTFDDNREGILKVIYNGNLDTYKKETDVDYHVLHVAQVTKANEPNIPCIVISRDINVRLKANALGLGAEDYEANKVCDSVMLDLGYSEVDISRHAFAELSLKDMCDVDMIFDDDETPYPNHYMLLKGPEAKQKMLAKVSNDRKYVLKLEDYPDELKIHPKNKEQSFAMDALLDPSIHLICLIGCAGTGKTLIATAAGEYLVENVLEYEKMLISRPIQPMGKDIGFLPGDVNEKLDPWMQPIYDALEIIHGKKTVQQPQTGDKKNKPKPISGKKIATESDKIAIEPLTYIRGRSIHNQFIIVDESQNLSPLEIKTIITRAGEHTKVVLTGDIYQIDNPYMDEKSNGLSVVLEAFKDSAIAAHIVMRDGVRSVLSEEATRRL